MHSEEKEATNYCTAVSTQYSNINGEYMESMGYSHCPQVFHSMEETDDFKIGQESHRG